MKNACQIFFAFLFLLVQQAKAEIGVTDSYILIGQTIGLSGPVAAPVREMMAGNKAYLDKINSQGGVYGRKIVIRTRDDGFDPARTLSNATALVEDDRVFALFQGRGTAHTLRILPLLEANGVPLFAPGSGASVFHDPVHPLIFNVRAKYQDEIRKAVAHFAIRGETIQLLMVDDAAGEDGLEGFTKAMSVHHLTPVAVTRFARVNPDINAASSDVVGYRAGAVIIVGSSKETIALIKAIRAKGGNMQIMTMSNNSSAAFVKQLGLAGIGVIVSQITPPPDILSTPLGQEFRQASESDSAILSYSAMEGYINAKVLVEGLRRAGQNLTRAGFLRALESMQRVDLGGIQITFSSNDHSGSEFVDLTMIGSTGRFVR